MVTLKSLQSRTLTSVAIMLASLGLAYMPLPGQQRTIVVVSGTELQEPLQVLAEKFEQASPHLQIDLKFQGSQDIVNNYIDDKNDFDPTILIPANGQLLTELSDRWQAQNSDAAFVAEPRAIAKTMLVAVAWPERGDALFPDGRFQWQQLATALQAGNWADIGGAANWGSFDLVTTDPTRSNSGQLALSLWARSHLGTTALPTPRLTDNSTQDLFSLVKRSIYQPPRSTDILLQEFITRGPNDADIAIVYESIALHRWPQASITQNQPYKIYYLDPTIETVATAAVVRRDVDQAEAKAAQAFLTFLTEPDQQAVFVQHGFRPTNPTVNLETVAESVWQQDIPGAESNPAGKVLPPPDRQALGEIIRLWQRAN
ncbi:MAG: ABC transporter substrate-binding protein [Cyanothece sp. SIO1E1]|nr:ABC transporter substrate-binding protein [Cyanothece sp. SIO1E1]